MSSPDGSPSKHRPTISRAGKLHVPAQQNADHRRRGTLATLSDPLKTFLDGVVRYRFVKLRTCIKVFASCGRRDRRPHLHPQEQVMPRNDVKVCPRWSDNLLGLHSPFSQSCANAWRRDWQPRAKLAAQRRTRPLQLRAGRLPQLLPRRRRRA